MIVAWTRARNACRIKSPSRARMRGVVGMAPYAELAQRSHAREIRLWFQRFTLLALVSLAGFGRFAPTLSVIVSTSTAVALPVETQPEHRREVRRSTEGREAQWQAIDERDVYEAEFAETASDEDDGLGYTLLPGKTRAPAADDELRRRTVSLTHAAQRLVDSARPRGPPAA
jgi:hypothetical protein